MESINQKTTLFDVFPQEWSNYCDLVGQGSNLHQWTGQKDSVA